MAQSGRTIALAVLGGIAIGATATYLLIAPNPPTAQSATAVQPRSVDPSDPEPSAASATAEPSDAVRTRLATPTDTAENGIVYHAIEPEPDQGPLHAELAACEERIRELEALVGTLRGATIASQWYGHRDRDGELVASARIHAVLAQLRYRNERARKYGEECLVTFDQLEALNRSLGPESTMRIVLEIWDANAALSTRRHEIPRRRERTPENADEVRSAIAFGQKTVEETCRRLATLGAPASVIALFRARYSQFIR